MAARGTAVVELIECPFCGSDNSEWSSRASLYQCDECGEWFEDDIPEIEQVERRERTKMHREE